MRAPELEVSAWLNSEPLALTGKVVALHFFQMLCPGCVVHGLPQAQNFFTFFQSDPNLQILAIHSVFEHHEVMTEAALRAFVHEFRYTLPIAIDQAEPGSPIPKTMRAYQCRGTPTWVLIDRQGQVVANLFGRVSDMELGVRIGKLLA
ncbi:redoxin domain-containing protein [Methylothermus subterraneus]